MYKPYKYVTDNIHEEDTILVGLLHYTPKEISKIYNIPLDIVREIIRRDEESN